METDVNKICVDISDQFKSYYVVWKHSDIAFNLSALLGLNRTMQYGNAYDNFVYNLNFQV